MLYLRLGAAAVCPVLLALIFLLLKKYTGFAKLSYKIRQIIIGVSFGIIACLATQYGVPSPDGYVLNVRSASPLTAGLLFGGPAGIIAGVIGGLYRWFGVYWGVPAYTRIACSVATVLAGLLPALYRRTMFRKNKTSWFYCIFITAATEVFHMLLVFVTHMDDIEKAFTVVKATAVTMICANCVSVGVSLVLVSLIKRQKIDRSKNARPITQTFSIFLLISMMFAFVVTSLFTFVLQDNVGNVQVENQLTMNIEDVKNDLRDATDRDLLAKAEKVAQSLKLQPTYSIAPDPENPFIGPNKRTSLVQYSSTNKLSEISIVDANGIILVSTNEDNDGYDLHEDPDGQIGEFLAILDGEVTSIVQAYQPTSINNNISRKYAAVKINDYYFLIAGYNQTRFQESVRTNVANVATNRHVGDNGFIFIYSPEENNLIISAPDHTVTQDDVAAFAGQIAELPDNTVLSYTTPEGVGYYYVKDTVEGFTVVGCIPVSEATFSRDISVYIGVFMLFVVFFILFLQVFYLIKRNIVDSIHHVNDDLKRITDGDLSTKVDVEGSEELTSLSQGINATVDRLKEYISEAEKRIDQELAFAKSIQHSALPSVFPPYPDRHEFEIFASMDTAKEVGGDFYDFYLINQDKLAFLIADVSGKGIPAAMFMMTAKTMLKSYVESGLEVEEVFTRANQKLCESNEAGMFVTAWMGVLDIKTGVVRYANAGHNPPLLKRADGTFEYFRTRPGLVLAGMDGIQYRAGETTLNPGDVFFLYTDGVTEATNGDNQLFSEERLRDTLNGLSTDGAADCCKAVKRAIDGFVKEAPQFDDITMLCLKYNSPDNDVVIGEKINEKTEEKTVKEINLDAVVENIEAVTEFVDAELEALDCPPKALIQINVAIDELFGNIAHYAYNPDKGPATVRVEVEENPLAVIITFIDGGKPFDPLALDDPDVTAKAEDRQIGGLGIFMVKKTMDSIEYEYQEGKNILKIKKTL